MISVESSRLSERKINSKISYEVKQKIKAYLINKKYGKKCQITWYLNKKVKEIKDYYEINGKHYDSHVYLRIITRKEKDEFREKNLSYSIKCINKYILNPINYIIKAFLFILLLKCFRKKIN
jgi:hypothetical protein